MRILFFPREPFPTDRVRINVLFARELVSRGHEIDFVMQAADASVPTGVRSWGTRRLWIGRTDGAAGFVNRLRKHWLGFRHDLRSIALIQRNEYDLLLVSDKFLFGSIAAFIARARGVPFVFWLTFPYPELDLYGAKVGTARYPTVARLRGRISGFALYRWILPRSDFAFVQSGRMLRDVAAHGVDERKMAPILTGFGIEQIPFAPRPPRAKITTIAYLGTLSADRKLDVLIDALHELVRSGIDTRLLLVGDADRERDRRLLEDRARELNVLERLEITGLLPQKEALARVAAADVALSPIPRSPVFDVGSPTKLVEYLALGIPVVANNHPEQREILSASKAGVCVPWSGRHFARGVRWILQRSEPEIQGMAVRGRQWVEQNRTYKVIADDVERRLLALEVQSSTSSST